VPSDGHIERQARRQLGEKWQHLRPPKRLANNNLAGRINAVDLKNALGQIESVVIFIPDGSHFACERLTAFSPWHLDAVSGSRPPHLLCDSGPSAGKWPL